jgi:hypothetical protein
LELLIANADNQPLGRSVYLTNDEWLILSQCVESFSDTFRAKHSQTIATYLTRGQVDEALKEAGNMNDLLKRLDMIQVALVS